MENTLLKLIVSQPSEAPGVPDTGSSTWLGADAISKFQSAMGVILLVVSVSLAILAITAVIRHRRLGKGSFSLARNKNSIIARWFLVALAIGGTGYLGGLALSESGIANAATDLEAATTGTVTIEAELGENPVLACGTDTVTINQALPAGYTLKMYAADLVMTNDANSKIMTTTTAGQLANNTWGYTLATTANAASILPVPTAATSIKAVEEATETGEATRVSYCVELGSDAKPGTYTTTIHYAIEPKYITYTLDYDANGGEFENGEAPETQTSGEVITTSYDFTITDAVPVVDTTEHPNKEFYGWSTTGDSLSDIYEAEDTITVTELETTLKAVWGYGHYTLTLNKNTTDTVNNFVSSQKCILAEEDATSCEVTITKRVPTREGYSLLGYSKEAYTPSENDSIDTARGKVDYKPGDTLTMKEDAEIYAVWWAVSTSDFQMELRWGELPRDLDSYLTGVRKSDGHQFTIYFSHKTEEIENGTITLTANLDIDDTSSYGPETVTLDMLPQSAYSDYDFYYYIHNYSGEDRGKLKESGANITLIKRGETIGEYDVATAAGVSARYWNVFAIKNGQIVQRNTLTANPELAY